MRPSNCAGALQYVPELTCILFFRILDERELREADEAEALGVSFIPTLSAPFRWRDWAAPGSPTRKDKKASIWDLVHQQVLPGTEDAQRQTECDREAKGRERNHVRRGSEPDRCRRSTSPSRSATAASCVSFRRNVVSFVSLNPRWRENPAGFALTGRR